MQGHPPPFGRARTADRPLGYSPFEITAGFQHPLAKRVAFITRAETRPGGALQRQADHIMIGLIAQGVKGILIEDLPRPRYALLQGDLPPGLAGVEEHEQKVDHPIRPVDEALYSTARVQARRADHLRPAVIGVRSQGYVYDRVA